MNQYQNQSVPSTLECAIKIQEIINKKIRSEKIAFDRLVNMLKTFIKDVFDKDSLQLDKHNGIDTKITLLFHYLDLDNLIKLSKKRVMEKSNMPTVIYWK